MWIPLQILSTSFWGAVNVLDSLLVAHHEKRPYVLQWHQSFFTLSGLTLIALLFPVTTPMAKWLFLGGMFAYIGDWVFFVTLDRVDVSVVNVAWAILAIILSIVGFFVFDEVWTLQQTCGAVLVLGGILTLSLWHRKVGNPRALLLLPLLALLNVPFYIAQKVGMSTGGDATAVFFWGLLGREVFAGSLPMIIPRWRRDALRVLKTQRWSFPVVNGLVVTLFFAAVWLTTYALKTGPVSLVSVVGNTQPFFVLFWSWLLLRCIPDRAAKELLTRQSIRVKIPSFAVVFIGLALIAQPQ